MHWQVYVRGQERRMHHAVLGGAFLSDKSGKKYKPTSKTDDGQNE